MKAHSSQLLSIEELVDQTLLDLGLGMHRKEQFLSWAVEIFKKWRQNMAREFKIASLDMTPWKSIILPSDCVDPILVGVKNGESFDTFTFKKLALRDCACDDSEPTTPQYCPEPGSEGRQWNNLTEFGEDPGKLYGLISKDNLLGYMNASHVEGSDEIQLSANIKAGTKIRLIYLATLFNPDVECCVHPYAQAAIQSYIHWRNLLMRRRAGNRNISPQDIRDAKDEFDNEWCELAEARMEMTSETIVELIRDGHRLSPKM
jgi:hypothetical protein